MAANTYQSEYGTRTGPETIITPGNGIALTGIPLPHHSYQTRVLIHVIDA